MLVRTNGSGVLSIDTESGVPRPPAGVDVASARAYTYANIAVIGEMSKFWTIAAGIACLAAWLGGTVGALGADGFERYQVILERKPFGEPPPTPPPPPPTDETPPWAEAYRLCSVYEDSNQRVQVALLDTKTNKPVMLTLGRDAVNGIELLAADIHEEEATLRKDGEEVTMKLTASKRPPPAKADPRKPPQARSVSRKGPAAKQAKDAASESKPKPNIARPRGVVRAGR